MGIDFGAAAAAGAGTMQPAATMKHPELIGQTIAQRSGPYDMEPVRNALADYEQQIDAMAKAAGAVEIKDAATAEYAVEIATRAKKAEKAIEKARKDWVEDPNAYVKAVNGLAKTYTTKLGAITDTVNAKYAKYQRELEAERRRIEEEQRREAARLQAEAEAEAKRLQAEAEAKGETLPPAPAVPEVIPAAAPAPSTITRAAAGSAHVRKVWKFDVQNVADVPREYMVVDEKSIRAAISNGIVNIPGIRIYQEEVTSFRTN